MRQSPSSSGKRSTTIVRSSGIAPVASTCSSRYATRLRAASSSSAVSARRCATASSVVRARRSRVNAPMARPSSMGRPGLVAVPERHLPLLAGRGEHDDAVVRDLVDAPRARAEHERLARPALVDHLLVELADAGALGEEHAEQPAVGDGAAVGDGDAAGAVAGAHACRGGGPTRSGAAAPRTRPTGSDRRGGRGRR